MIFPITTRPATRADLPNHPGMTLPSGTMIVGDAPPLRLERPHRPLIELAPNYFEIPDAYVPHVVGSGPLPPTVAGPLPDMLAPFVRPQGWTKFHPKHDEEFYRALLEFRGNADTKPNTKYSGGEGILFLHPDYRPTALKRWYKTRIKDFGQSVKLLEEIGKDIASDAELAAYIRVVKIYKQGSDWILRDFDPTSVPLRDALSDRKASEARDRVIAALRAKQKRSNAMNKLLERIQRKSPSDNLHWSTVDKQILIIDMQ